MRKKLLIFSLILIFFPTYTRAMVNNNNISISEIEYQRLRNLGFTENEIQSMPEDVYEENKNLVGNVIEENTKYYKNTYIYPNHSAYSITALQNMEPVIISEEITKEEFEASKESVDISPLESQTVTQDTRSLTTSIIKVGNNYRVKNTVSWGKIPNTKSKDVSGIQINQSVVEPKSGSEHAWTSFDYNDNCRGGTTSGRSTNDNQYSKGPNGYGVIHSLPSGTITESIRNSFGSNWPCSKVAAPPLNTTVNIVHTLRTLEHTMYYDLIKLQSNPISAYGNYKHARSSTSSMTSADFSIGTGGVSLVISISSNYSNNFDTFNGTHVQITNPNW